MLLRDRSTLELEFDRLKLDVWFVVMLLLIRLSELSTLDEALERVRLEV